MSLRLTAAPEMKFQRLIPVQYAPWFSQIFPIRRVRSPQVGQSLHIHNSLPRLIPPSLLHRGYQHMSRTSRVDIYTRIRLPIIQFSKGR